MLFSDEYDFRFTCGISKAHITFSEKQSVIRAMCLHYSVLVSLAELEQLRRGLSLMKFDSLMSSFPSLLKKAFQPPECKITSDYIQDLFFPDFSARGSNSRNKEEVIMMMWICYLRYLAGIQSLLHV